MKVVRGGAAFSPCGAAHLACRSVWGDAAGSSPVTPGAACATLGACWWQKKPLYTVSLEARDKTIPVSTLPGKGVMAQRETNMAFPLVPCL